MNPPDVNALPKDPYLKKIADNGEKIKDIPTFISQVNSYIKVRGSEKYICVFRGEPEIYQTPCKPFLFRSDILAKNKFFEKNLFGSMRQNKFTGERCYLDNAIDA